MEFSTAGRSKTRDGRFDENAWRFSLVQLGKHRAAKRLLERLGEVLLDVGRDVEPAIRLGEAFRIENALLAGPREILHAKRDDVTR